MKKAIILLSAILLSIGIQAKGFKLVTGEPLQSQHEELDAKGRNGIMIKQKLTFGSYYTTSVKRSAIRKWYSASGVMNYIWTEHMEGKQKIHFRLTSNGSADTSDVLAVSNVSSRDLVIGSNPNTLPNRVSSILRIGTENQQNNYSVAIYTNKDEQPWELFLDNTNAQLERSEYVGYVTRGDAYYTIIPVWTIERKNGKTAKLPFGTAGFEIRNEAGNTLAAVSLMNNGKVYLGQLDEKEKFLMSNICAALLLQSNINE